MSEQLNQGFVAPEAVWERQHPNVEQDTPPTGENGFKVPEPVWEAQIPDTEPQGVVPTNETGFVAPKAVWEEDSTDPTRPSGQDTFAQRLAVTAARAQNLSPSDYQTTRNTELSDPNVDTTEGNETPDTSDSGLRGLN